MRIAVFSTKAYDRRFLEQANKGTHSFQFFDSHLNSQTATLAQGFEVVCAFVNDHLDRPTIESLKKSGVKLVTLRCAGFNNVDLKAAAEAGIRITRVPKYSPHAVAEHTMALALALNRKLCRAYSRVRNGDFSLDGLLGFDLCGKTVGVVGTGNIGAIVAKMFQSFGCHVLAADPIPERSCIEAGIRYVSLQDLFAQSDIITLHCPLTSTTRHLINDQAIRSMKNSVMILNTGRGALIDTKAVIQGLKSGKIGYLGLDVYEEEEELFFEDLSEAIIQDDIFSRLLTFPNVVITAHQAFFTIEALTHIAQTTLSNIAEFESKKTLSNEVRAS